MLILAATAVREMDNQNQNNDSWVTNVAMSKTVVNVSATIVIADRIFTDAYAKTINKVPIMIANSMVSEAGSISVVNSV